MRLPHIDAQDRTDTSMFGVKFHHFGQGEGTANVDVAYEDILWDRRTEYGIAD